ncbi:MAG: mucoidy inhibitor MuiA family protein [Candidatus Thorarchaeota archaeon]|nr:MAG: mucoidy inhibitor MuiA family protein [Candidatus Thorarchaeota archaeon]
MKELQTKITSTTVFRDGARVVRTGKTEIEKGEQVIHVGGITQYAHEDSFRVKGRGHAVLRGIDVKRVSKTYEPEGDTKEMLEKLKALEKQRKDLQDQLELQQTRISHQTNVMNQFSTEFGKWFSVGETGLENLTKMDKANQDMITSAKKNLRKLTRELQEIDAESRAVRENIQRIQGERRTETHSEVYVTVDAKQSTTLELEITYQISPANWYSTYDVDIGEGTTSLKRIAMVSNNSMEDWEDISLIVSTASAQPVSIVKPNPYYVNTLSATMTKSGYGGVAPRWVLRSVSEDSDDKWEEEKMDDLVSGFAEELMPEIIEEYATSSETLGGITVYAVPGKITIEANKDPSPITLTLDEFESKRLHYWNAYAMQEVVAQDEITNGDSVLLPGSVKVYAAGDYIGETNLGTISPREKFRLGTRAAYDVKAERKLLEKDTEKAGFTRGKQKRGYTYSLELKNFSKREIEIRIVDRIPYSNSEKILVELAEPSLVYKKMELGVLTWETKMETDKELKIKYSYDVEWEKELSIRPPLP